MHRSGRLTLIKTMLSVIPFYTSIRVGLPSINLSLTRSIDRCMFSFLISQGSCACTRARAPGYGRHARQGASRAFLVATESWPRFKRWM
jgi:hypothetical protein